MEMKEEKDKISSECNEIIAKDVMISKEESSDDLQHFSKLEEDESDELQKLHISKTNKQYIEEFLKISPQEEECKEEQLRKMQKYDFKINPFLSIFEEFLKGEEKNVSLCLDLVLDFNEINHKMDELNILYNQLNFILGLKCARQRKTDNMNLSVLAIGILEDLEEYMEDLMKNDKRSKYLSIENDETFFYGVNLNKVHLILKNNHLSNVAAQIYVNEFISLVFKTLILIEYDSI